MNIKIDTTLERDIDLLILEEFISNPEFASIFLKAVGISDAYTIETAIHSKMDAELGESDIVFVLNINGKRQLYLLIIAIMTLCPIKRFRWI